MRRVVGILVENPNRLNRLEPHGRVHVANTHYTSQAQNRYGKINGVKDTHIQKHCTASGSPTIALAATLGRTVDR